MGTGMTVRVDPRGWALIDQTFSPRELETIWTAIDHIQAGGLFQTPTQTGSAVDPRTGQVIKRNRSVFLDDLTPEDCPLDIRPLIASVWTNRQIVKALTGVHPCYGLLNTVNYSTSLLSYYETGESYPAHRDRSVFTVLTWLYREPRQWQGGDLKLTQFGVTHRVQNNQSMIFPGCYLHEATATQMLTNEPGAGRYCLAQFGYVKP
jgi:hypothetical protein